ncbi:MAG: M56 family metallopeptidase, partial [Oscillospiraceae bacterium]|nr:M56 family metallopeptidase [Oscillospiraceae bacterium]
MLDFLNTLFQSLTPLWEMSVTAAYAAAVVMVLRLLLKKRAPRQVLCLLWLVVFARLLIPVSLESPLSIVPSALPGQEQQIQAASGTPSTPDAGNAVNPITPHT